MISNRASTLNIVEAFNRASLTDVKQCLLQ